MKHGGVGVEVEVEERKREEQGEETDKREGMVEKDGVEKEEERGGGCEGGARTEGEDEID